MNITIMKLNSILVLAVLLLASCSDPSDELKVENTFDYQAFEFKELSNKKLERLIIENDTLLGIYSQVSVWQPDDTEYIYCYNRSNKSIEVFDLSNRTYVKTIRTDSHHALATTEWLEFLPVSKDTMLLFASGGQLGVLVKDQFNQRLNFQRIISSSVELSGVDPLNNKNSVIKAGSNFLIRSFPSHSLNGDYRFFKEPFMIEFDLANEKVLDHFGDFPDYMAADKKMMLVNDYRFSWMLGKDEKHLYISHRRDPHIYRLDLETKEQVKIPAPSSHLRRFELIPRKYDSQRELNSIITQGVYHGLKYDKYRNVYYRVATHNQPLKNKKTNRLNNAARRAFSVVVLDSDFNYLGESVFDNNSEYSYLNFEVSSDGIILPIYDNDEKIVTFDVYEIEL